MTTLLGTYHPAALKKSEMKLAPTFLHDIAKLKRILDGVGWHYPPTTFNPIPVSPPGCDLPIAVEHWLSNEWKGKWAFDLEGDMSRVTSAAFCGEDNAGFVLGEYQFREALPGLRTAFKDARRIVVQNGAYDLPIMMKYGVVPRWEAVWDTMLAGYILAPDDYVSLTHLCSIYLDVEAWKHEREHGDLGEYNLKDANYTWPLYGMLSAELAAKSQLAFFEDHLMPVLWKAIIPLNARGIALDGRKRKDMLDDWLDEVVRWELKMRKHFTDMGMEPPVEPKGLSSKKVMEVLYDTLKLPRQYHPTTRKLTGDQGALEKLKSTDTTGTVAVLLERSLLKEKEVQLQVKSDSDGRVRSRYVLGGDEKHIELTKEGSSRSKDKGTRTGRLASREPNLQNVPKSVRCIYVPSHDGWWFVEGDSSQIEARLTQWFSGDTALKEAIDRGDIYLYTLLLIDRLTDLYGVHNEGWEGLQSRHAAEDDAVTAWREESKRSFLGWSYRMGAKQLELRYGVPYPRAKKVIEALNHTFRRVVTFWAECERFVATRGYLENPFCRRRYFPVPDVPKICNFKAQSTGADILFRGQRALNVDPVSSALDNDPDLGYFLTTTHDSNLTEGPEWRPLAQRLKVAMEQPIVQMDGLVIPCTVKVGRNWGEMKRVTL